MDYEGINGAVTAFGAVGLGIWTVISSFQRAEEDEKGEYISQLFTLLIFRGLVFGLTFSAAMELAGSRSLYFLSIPALIAGGLYINHLGKSRY
jgi:hypothetical protein